MKGKITAAVLAAAMVFSLLPAGVWAAKSDTDVAYPVTGGNIYFDKSYGMITDCDETVTEAVIPAQIEDVDVTGIRSRAFTKGKGLTRVDIPDSVTYMSTDPFYWCSGLEEINVSENNPEFSSENGVLFNKDKTKLIAYPLGNSAETYEVPGGVTEIGIYAFEYCQNLKNVIISNGVTTIGKRGFCFSAELESVSIPESVTTIESDAFHGCDKLSAIYIPAGVTSIGECAFDYSKGLKSIEVSAENASYLSEEGVLFNKDKTVLMQYPVGSENRVYIIPEGVTQIDKMAFGYSENLNVIEIPDSVETINYAAFTQVYLTDIYYNGSEEKWSEISVGLSNEALSNAQIHFNSSIDGPIDIIDGGSCGNTALWVLDSEGTLTIKGSGEMRNYGYVILAPWHVYKDDIQRVVIENGITKIPDAIFNGYSSISSVTIPGSVKTIGASAFNGCTRLTSIEIPEGVETIGNYAFKDCKYLTDAEIADTVVNVGSGIFDNCTRLVNVKLSSGMTEIPERMFVGCRYLESIDVSAGISDIKIDSFSTCYALKNINVDEDNTVYSSENGVLFNKDKTEIVIYPSGKTEESYVIPDSVERVGKLAFSWNEYLVSVEIPNSVTSMGTYVFYGCEKLKNVTIPDGIEEIGQCMFCFCYDLESVAIPKSVKNIERSAFYYCGKFTDVYYGGTEDEWNEITIDSNNNDALLNAEIHFEVPVVEIIASGECGVNGDNVTWTLDAEGTLTISGTGAMVDYIRASIVPWNSYRGFIRKGIIGGNVTNIGNYTFESCKNLTSAVIADSVIKIGNNVFYGCSGLQSIDIPRNVTSIGGCAFWGCSGLKSIDLPPGITAISLDMLRECTGLTNLVIPDGVTSTGWGALMGCTGLKSVTIPDSLTNLGEFTFHNCTGLTSIRIPEGVKYIGQGVFQKCSGLKSLNFPDSVTTIITSSFIGCTSLENINVSAGNTAFSSVDGVLFNKDETEIVQYPLGRAAASYTIPDGTVSIGRFSLRGADNLTEVIIPDSVTEIKGCAFYECAGLSQIVIPNSVISIGEDAFYKCLSLKSIEIPEKVTIIDELMFLSCENLESVTIPKSVVQIGDRAFEKCRNLKDVYYRGSEDDWNKITVNNTDYEGNEYVNALYGNNPLLNAVIHFNTIPVVTYLVGDVNSDGVVNAKDKTILNRYLAGWEGYDAKILNWDAADVNKDGTVNAKDKTILNRYLAGWEGYSQYFSENS